MAIADAKGHQAMALVWLVAGLAAAVLTIGLGAWMIDKLYTGALDMSAPAARRAKQTRRKKRDSWLAGILPQGYAAMLGKEMRYFWREPLVKTQIIGVLYMVGVWGIMGWRMRGDLHNAPQILTHGVTFMMVMGIFLMEAQFSFNMFGIEGDAAPALFLYPLSRRSILAAKATYSIMFVTGINMVIVPLGCLFMRSLSFCLPLITYTLLASAVYAGIGCLVSIHFAMRLVSWSGRRMGSRQMQMGCGRSIIYMLIALAAMAATLPVAAAVLLPPLFGHPIWLLVTIPFAAAYAAGVFYFCLTRAATQLSEREIEVIDAVGPRRST